MSEGVLEAIQLYNLNDLSVFVVIWGGGGAGKADSFMVYTARVSGLGFHKP